MRISYLCEFSRLAQQLNFKKTADELHISQSALSKHVQALEDDLGVALFERDRHHVMLTPEGEIFQIKAQAIVELYETTKENFAASARTENHLVVGGIVDGPRCYAWIAKASEYVIKNHHQRFTPHFVPVSTTRPVMQVVNKEIDCAIMAFVPDDYSDTILNDIEYTHITESTVYAIVSAQSPLAQCQKLTVADLDGQRYVRLVSPRTSSGWQAVSRFMQRNGISCKVEERHILSAFDAGTLELDDEILLMPAHDVQWALAAATGKAVVELDVPYPTMPVDIVYRKDNQTPALKMFVEALKATPIE
jgi:DNA-binding transcriptional LysR family regulator